MISMFGLLFDTDIGIVTLSALQYRALKLAEPTTFRIAFTANVSFYLSFLKKLVRRRESAKYF